MAESKLLSRLGDPARTLYLIDISSFIFRAFFAIRSLKNHAGEPTNAIYGVANMVARLAEDAQPRHVGVVYDSKEPSFRKEIYEDYKANRSAPPDDLIPQFDKIEEMIRLFEIHSFRQSGVEADDLIATLTRRWRQLGPDNRVVIVSSDKDLMQLVDSQVCLWDTMNSKVYGPAEVEEKFGVRPSQIRDYLALVGDASDNIPGVEGIGPKTAVELLKAHETLFGVLTAADQGKVSGKKGETLKVQKDRALLSAELATVHTELEIVFDPAAFDYHFHVTPACHDFLTRMDFHTLARKWSIPGESLAESAISTAAGAGLPSSPVRAAPPGPAAPSAAQGEFRMDGSGGSATAVDATIAPAAHATETARAIAGASAGRADWRAEVGSGIDCGRTFRTIQTEADFTRLLARLERHKEFGFDLETTSLNPRAASLVGVAITYDPEFGCYIPLAHRSLLGGENPQLSERRVLEGLRPFLEDPKYKKIGQNLKYDWVVLFEHGLKPDGIGADTMVASYVLDPEGRHNLETLAARYLGYGVMTYEQVCGKGKDQIGFDQVPIDLATRYSAEDAWLALRLWRKISPILAQEGLMETFAKVDMPLVPVLCRMEREGVCIDVDWLAELSNRFSKELRSIEERIAAFTKAPVNLNSPKQLALLLFEELKLPTQSKTKTGFSTDATVLEALAPLHEVPRLLLEYREISKLKGTYVDPLPGLRDIKTGRIHGSFHQAVAATGRLSSSDPNLQNIPIRSDRGKLIRRAFVPSPGHVLISADYSQIELRLLAHMSGDVELVRSFRADEDVHRRTASEVFAIPPEEVTDRQRGIAKAINFGLMYGKTPFGLSQELKIPRKEAQEVIDRYFARYKGVKHYLDHTILEAKERGYVTTVVGRKRYLLDLRSANPAVRANAERMAMNTPIQGTAADLMKLAMIEIDRRLATERFGSRLILQVHDEVLLDCPPSEAKRAQAMVCEVMEGAMKLDVPLRVNSAAGANWMEI